MAAEKGLSFLLKTLAAGIAATVNATTDLVTMTAHGLLAGSPVVFTTTGVLPALASGTFTANKVFYAGTILANTFSLHLTKAAGIAGTGGLDFTDTGSGTHTGKPLITVAGMRTTAFTIGGEEVDITTKDATAGWRDLLAESGVTTFAITAAGVYQDDVTLQNMRIAVITKVLDTYSLVFESGDEYFGFFQVLSVEQSGEFNGEVTYSISLESSGEIQIITNT